MLFKYQLLKRKVKNILQTYYNNYYAPGLSTIEWNGDMTIDIHEY